MYYCDAAYKSELSHSTTGEQICMIKSSTAHSGGNATEGWLTTSWLVEQEVQLVAGSAQKDWPQSSVPHPQSKLPITVVFRNLLLTKYHHPQPFYGHFNSRTTLRPGWAGARRELLDFMVQGKINRGRHTDHPAGRHSIRTNSAHLNHPPCCLQARCPSCRPTNSVKALKATSTLGLGRRR